MTTAGAMPISGVASGAIIIAPITAAVEFASMPAVAITADSVRRIQNLDIFAGYPCGQQQRILQFQQSPLELGWITERWPATIGSRPIGLLGHCLARACAKCAPTGRPDGADLDICSTR